VHVTWKHHDSATSRAKFENSKLLSRLSWGNPNGRGRVENKTTTKEMLYIETLHLASMYHLPIYPVSTNITIHPAASPCKSTYNHATNHLQRTLLLRRHFLDCRIVGRRLHLRLPLQSLPDPRRLRVRLNESHDIQAGWRTLLRQRAQTLSR